MYNNATFIDAQQLKFLQQMDIWLKNQDPKSETDLNAIREVRELISKIEKQGYYYEGEAELLNLLREDYIKELKSKK